MTLVVIRLGERVYNGSENEEGYELFDFLNLIMYPHNKNFMEDMSKYIDFSKNEELWKEAENMSGLGQSILEEGRTEGRTEGRDIINLLIFCLVHDGRSEDIEKAASDSAYQDELIQYYGLDKKVEKLEV